MRSFPELKQALAKYNGAPAGGAAAAGFGRDMSHQLTTAMKQLFTEMDNKYVIGLYLCDIGVRTLWPDGEE
jgi:hypothetical protein